MDFLAAIGLRTTVEDGVTRGRARVTPAVLVPGTDRLRFGVLASLVDVVGGSPPTGAVNPTVDMRVRLLAPPPSSGTLLLECRPVKQGARLYLAEVLAFAEGSTTPFAVGITTFVNRLIEAPPGRGRAEPPVDELSSIEEALGARVVGPGVVELDMHGGIHNPVTSTIFGGGQALLAELAAEDLLAPRGPHRVVDLDIRYVNRVHEGPVFARAEVLPTVPIAAGCPDEVAVRVVLAEPTPDGDRTISLVNLSCLPADD